MDVDVDEDVDVAAAVEDFRGTRRACLRLCVWCACLSVFASCCVRVVAFLSHPVYYLRPSFYSLFVRAQIRGHIVVGSSPPLPTTVRAFPFLSLEGFSPFFPRRLALLVSVCVCFDVFTLVLVFWCVFVVHDCVPVYILCTGSSCLD